MNPLVMDIFEEFKDHPSAKPMIVFGGQGNWILMNTIFSIVLTIIHQIVFLIIYNSLPGNKWLKGLSYSGIVILISVIPESFNLFMTIKYPNKLILTLLITHIISYFLLGMIMTYVFNKSKAFYYE